MLCWWLVLTSARYSKLGTRASVMSATKNLLPTSKRVFLLPSTSTQKPTHESTKAANLHARRAM